MFNISSTEQAAWQSSTQKDLTLTFTKGSTTITLTNENIVSESMKLRQTVADNSDNIFGNLYASEFNIQIFDDGTRYVGYTLTVSISVTTDEDVTYTRQLGVFKVTSDKLTADEITRNIVAYDSLVAVLKEDYSSWHNALSFPTTVYNYRTAFFAYLGISQETVSLPNDSVSINENDLDAVSGATILSSILMLNACWGYIGSDNVFHYALPTELGFIGREESSEEATFYDTTSGSVTSLTVSGITSSATDIELVIYDTTNDVSSDAISFEYGTSASGNVSITIESQSKVYAMHYDYDGDQTFSIYINEIASSEIDGYMTVSYTVEASTDHEISDNSFIQSSFAFEEYETAEYTGVYFYNTITTSITEVIDEDTGETTTYDETSEQNVAVGDATGSVLTLSNNLLLKDKTDSELTTIGNTILTALDNFVYTPASVKFPPYMGIELGDTFQISVSKTVDETELSYTVFFPVLDRTLSGITALKDTFTAVGVEYSSENANSLQALMAKYNAVSNQLSSLSNEISRIANTAKTIAASTNQYFWNVESTIYFLTEDTTVDTDKTYYELSGSVYTAVTPSGTEDPSDEGWYEAFADTGAHITEIPKDDFISDPDNGGGNLLARSNGIAVRNGLTELASFGSVVEVGELSSSHIEITNDEFAIYDSNPSKAFYISVGETTTTINAEYPIKYTAIISDDDSSIVSGRTFTDSATSTNSELNNSSCDGVYVYWWIDLYYAREYDHYQAGGRTYCKVDTNVTYTEKNSSGTTVFTITLYYDSATCELTVTIYNSYTYYIVDKYYFAISAYKKSITGYPPVLTFGTRTDGETLGSYSAALGISTTASGLGSTAFGYNTTASGTYSHAQNYSTTAAGRYQTVIGKFNETDSNNEYSLIIGGGFSGTPKNILTVDWYGGVTLADYLDVAGRITDESLLKSATITLWENILGIS